MTTENPALDPTQDHLQALLRQLRADEGTADMGMLIQNIAVEHNETAFEVNNLRRELNHMQGRLQALAYETGTNIIMRVQRNPKESDKVVLCGLVWDGRYKRLLTEQRMLSVVPIDEEAFINVRVSEIRPLLR